MENYTPDQISAFWSGVGAIATAAAAIVAIVTLLALKQDSRDRTRPQMGAFLQPDVLTKATAILVVKNYGPTAAVNVKVTFDPPLPQLEGAEAQGLVTPFLERRYRGVIPTIVPQMELVNVYQQGYGGESREPVADEVTVTFHYTDAEKRSKYTDAYVLSMATLKDATGSYPANDDEKGMRKRSIKALEAIARGIGRH
ncbi:hypothetical protein [Pedococcus soli]